MRITRKNIQQEVEKQIELAQKIMVEKYSNQPINNLVASVGFRKLNRVSYTVGVLFVDKDSDEKVVKSIHKSDADFNIVWKYGNTDFSIAL